MIENENLHLHRDVSTLLDTSDMIEKKLNEIDALQRMIYDNQSNLSDLISRAAMLIANLNKNKGMLYATGNGGAMATASHLVAELSGRFKYENTTVPASTLGADAALTTALGNDYQSFDGILMREVAAKVREGDIFVGLTTSGSFNILQAAAEALERNVSVILLIGNKEDNKQVNFETRIRQRVVGGIYKEMVVIPCYGFTYTPIIQEYHMMIVHLICEMVDEILVNGGRVHEEG